MLLSPSLLPLVPLAFSVGDSVTHSRCSFERVAADRWVCVKCGPTSPASSDVQMRERFTEPIHLETFGAPLLAPVTPAAGEPLPGRPVRDGESPFEPGGTYLMCSTGNEEPPTLHGLRSEKPGPWGPAQAALVATGQRISGPSHGWYERSMTETGTVYIRMDDGAVTLAYVPAGPPTDDEAAALVAYTALRDSGALTVRLDRL